MTAPRSGSLKDFDLGLGAFTLRATADESQAGQANWLLGALAQLNAPDAPLQDGLRVRIGWTIFILRLFGQVFQICTPDLRENPARAETTDLTDALAVMALMVDFLKQLHIDDRDDLPLFSEKVVVEKGALQAQELYLERRPRSGRDDSGWFIGRDGEAQPAGRYEAVRVYQLLVLRPELLRVLGLPAGFLVTVSGGQIRMVVDDQQQEIWQA